ncbi:TPA: hypothetical protein ACH3X1_012655 [Trebouxia sp. C0004]
MQKQSSISWQQQSKSNANLLLLLQPEFSVMKVSVSIVQRALRWEGLKHLRPKPHLIPEGKRLFQQAGRRADKWKLQQNDAAAHKTKESMQCISDIIPGGLFLEWPPKSPDLSSIENLWAWMEQQLGDREGIHNTDDMQSTLKNVTKAGSPPERLWTLVKHEAPELSSLALRLMAISVNAAGCGRIFLQMGLTHTKLRNRLGHAKTIHIAQLRQELHRNRQPRKRARADSIASGSASCSAQAVSASASQDQLMDLDALLSALEFPFSEASLSRQQDSSSFIGLWPNCAACMGYMSKELVHVDDNTNAANLTSTLMG